MQPDLDDDRIQALADLFDQSAEQLADHFAELAVATLVTVRLMLLTEVRNLLRTLRKKLQQWFRDDWSSIVHEVATEVYDDRDFEFLENEPESSFFGNVQEADEREIATTFAAAMLIGGVRAVTLKLRQDLTAAINSTEGVAVRLSRGVLSDVPAKHLARLQALRRQQVVSAATSTEPELAAIRLQLRETFRTSLVRVIGTNARTYAYDFKYYAALAVSQAKENTRTALATERVAAADHDLVQISKNPSLIGDYCDLYRGKVFSLSGSHAIFPPLSSAPNGGPPFHPWCRHTIKPFDDSGMTDDQRRSLVIPAQFQRMAVFGATPSQFQTAYRLFRRLGPE